MRELLHTPWYLAQKEIQVKYSEVNGEWRITGKNADSPRNAFAYATYGTERANAYRILEDTLNLKDVRIYDKSVNENGDEFVSSIKRNYVGITKAGCFEGCIPRLDF